MADFNEVMARANAELCFKKESERKELSSCQAFFRSTRFLLCCQTFFVNDYKKRNYYLDRPLHEQMKKVHK